MRTRLPIRRPSGLAPAGGSQEGARLAWLDGLRAVAAGMVFLCHAGPGTWLEGLDAGVLVFFSLSGYLLYRPFLEHRVDPWAYAMRRLFRILPAYLVASVAIGWLDHAPLDLWGIVTMGHTPVLVAWTLQIEVVFYAALPLIAVVAGARRPILWLMAAASVLAGALSVVTFHVLPQGFVPWAWAFVPGMVVAQQAFRRHLAVRGWLAPVGVALIAVSVVPNIAYPDAPAAVGSALILAWLLTLPAPRPWLGRAMAAGGAVSYSFYLWHEAIRDLVGSATILHAGIAFVLTTAVAAAIYVVIERPAIRLGRELGSHRPWAAWLQRHAFAGE